MEIKIAIGIIIGIVLVLAAVLFAVSARFFRLAFSRYLKKEDREKEKISVWDAPTPDKGLENEPESIRPYIEEMRSSGRWIRAQKPVKYETTSYDGLKLSARFVPAENMKGIVLMMHGFRSNPLHDFSCAVQYFCENGWACLLPWQRAHGESEGKYIYYGTREKYDVVAWARLLEKEFPGVPVVLDGVSMGGSTVLFASGLELPENVKGVIADCGFTSPLDIFEAVLKNMFKLPKFPILYSACIASKLITGINLRESTTDAVKKNKLPLVIAHGEKDGFVPYEMGKRNYEAAKSCGCDVTFISVKEADHGLSYMVERERYQEEIHKMFGECIK